MALSSLHLLSRDANSRQAKLHLGGCPLRPSLEVAPVTVSGAQTLLGVTAGTARSPCRLGCGLRGADSRPSTRGGLGGPPPCQHLLGKARDSLARGGPGGRVLAVGRF